MSGQLWPRRPMAACFTPLLQGNTGGTGAEQTTRSMAPSHEPHHHHRGRQTRLTRTPRPVGSPPEPHETARALRARLRPPHGPTRPARCRPGLQASGHGPPEADWPKAYLPFYSEPLDDPWLCRHVKLLKNRLVPQTYIESDALGRQMYLQAKNSSTCAHEA